MCNVVMKCSNGGILEAMDPVSQVVRQLDDLVNTIDASIEEQSAVTGKMARDAAEGAEREGRDGDREFQIVACAPEIEKEIDEAGHSSEDGRGPCSAAGVRRTGLPELAEQLTAMVECCGIDDDESNPKGKTGVLTPSHSHRPFFEWSNRISSGIPGMDHQHRQFLVLISDLHDSTKHGNGREARMKIVDELVHCSKCPFAAEEWLREKYPWSDLRLGKKAHRRLVGIIGEFQRRFEEGDPLAVFEAMNALRDWLIDHIRQLQGGHGPYVH